jgi:hypothetical protein
VLVDPDAVADLTPFVRSIVASTDPDGVLWRWSLAGLRVAGLEVAPEFTERMRLDEPSRITFAHEPPGGTSERAGVTGSYDLTALSERSTRLATELEISLDLPLPRLAGPAVRTAMQGVMATMGRGFSSGLLERVNPRPGRE